jgi:hypothetical protein
MSATPAPEEPLDSAAIAAGLRAATAALEAAAADFAQLALLTDAERIRLVQAAANIFCPAPRARRRLVKAKNRRELQARLQRDESLRDETGIRKLRRQSKFTTPDLETPPGCEPAEVDGDPDFREMTRALVCYVCKRPYAQIHHFYDLSARSAATSTSRSATRPPICAARSRWSPAAASRSVIRPASSCCAPAHA